MTSAPFRPNIEGLETRLINASVCCPWRAGQPAPLLETAATALAQFEAYVRWLESEAREVATFYRDCWSKRHATDDAFLPTAKYRLIPSNELLHDKGSRAAAFVQSLSEEK